MPPPGRPPASRRPRLMLLATGGTIAGAAVAGLPGGYRAGTRAAAALVAGVPGLAARARLQVVTVAQIGSQDMDEGVWRDLARQAQAAVDTPGVAGVVITHGTDTMEETAYFLSLVLRTAKPVVLVGAMRPATAISADGPMNLYNAVATAADPAAGGRGVLVVANDEIHFAREVAKTHTTRVGTFRSTLRGLAGVVTAGHVHFYGPPGRRPMVPSPFRLPAQALPRVEIIYAYAGMGADSIHAAVAGGCRGLVIAGVGSGNLGASARGAAAQAVAQGLAVVRSSRTGGGSVERNVEIDDDGLGFIAAGELNPQKARILLMLGLTRTRDPAKLQAWFHPC